MSDRSPALSLLLSLRRPRPTAERLRELLTLISNWGYDGLSLAWGESFPWSLDERFRANAYREELVAGVYREARGLGLAVSTLFPRIDQLSFIARFPEYRHLFRDLLGTPTLDLPAGRKLLRDLVADLLQLVPEPGRVIVPYVPSDPIAAWEVASAFRSAGVAVTLWLTALDDESLPDLQRNRSLFERFLLPVGLGVPRGGEGFPVVDLVAIPPGGRPAAAALRDHLTPTTRPPARGRLIALQPEGAGGPSVVHAGPLDESIELALPAVRSIGLELGGGVRAGEVDEAIVPEAEELRVALDRAWSTIRAAHEALAGGPAGRERAVRRVAELEVQRRRLRSLAGGLRGRLERVAEAAEVGDALSMLLDPVQEQYYHLLPRVRRELDQGEMEANGPA